MVWFEYEFYNISFNLMHINYSFFVFLGSNFLTNAVIASFFGGNLSTTCLLFVYYLSTTDAKNTVFLPKDTKDECRENNVFSGVSGFW